MTDATPLQLQRESLRRRADSLRRLAALDKATYEHWNRLHPDEPPIDTSFEDAVIAWCDGKGLLPTPPVVSQIVVAGVDVCPDRLEHVITPWGPSTEGPRP